MKHNRIFRDIMRDYEKSKERAWAMLEERRKAVYEEMPRLAEIDKSLGAIGLSLARITLTGGDKGEVRAEAERLKEERRAILAEMGLAEGYLSPVYRCAVCSDTGYLPPTPQSPAARCACLKQQLIDEYYALSNMKEVLREENFDTFDIRLFSTQINESEGLSPRLNMENIHRLTTRFVQNFNTGLGSDFTNLLLYGETGLGKTFICHCIAKDLLDAGRTVLYLTAPRLCRVIENSRFHREALAEPDEMLDAVDEVDLLILDDLGAEISTIVTSAALFDVINQRLLLRKPTVISTNLNQTALESQYSERIVSRFSGNYQMIKFFGEDIRVKKKYGGLSI